MAWQISATNDNRYRPHVEFTPEDADLYEAMKDELRRNQNLWTVEDIGVLKGFQYPAPKRPFKIKVASNQRDLPDILNAKFTWAFTRQVVELIETLEPGVHRYWPVEVEFNDGKTAEPRWLLNICSRLDTIVIERSDVGVVENPLGHPGQIIPKFNTMAVSSAGSGPQHLSMSKEKIGRHSLWCEYRYNPSTFISSELKTALQQAGSLGLEFVLETREV